MAARSIAAIAGVGLAVSGLLPWTAGGLSGVYVAGLGGLFLLAGLVVAGVAVAAPKNRVAMWTILGLSLLGGLFALVAVGFMKSVGEGLQIGYAFYLMIACSGLGVWSSQIWLEPTSDVNSPTAESDHP